MKGLKIRSCIVSMTTSFLLLAMPLSEARQGGVGTTLNMEKYRRLSVKYTGGCLPVINYM
jgi:hypothetical protein